jgi:predicted nucleic acid-binding protein
MTLVVDASVVIKLYVDEVGSERARHDLALAKALIAPGLLLAEVGNVLWRLARRGELSDAQLTKIPIELPLLFDDLVPIRELLVAALAIAREIDHPVYGCFYLALAQERGAPLVTADKRLVARVAGSRFAPLVRPL